MLMTHTEIIENFKDAERLVTNFYENKNNIDLISRVGEELKTLILKGNKIISCGNGGSMTDAMHFAEELTGRFRDERASIPAVAISDAGFLTCAANDYGYEKVFSRFIEGMGNKGDALLAISTSGNSQNVINAAIAAKDKGLLVVGLTGKDGGQLADLCDYEIRIVHQGYADRIQEMHIKIIHTLVQYVEKAVK